MEKPIVSLIVMLALPAVVFLGGAQIMMRMSDREPVELKPLNRRFGYDAADAREYWQASDQKAPGAERRFLELDLVFPFLYGGALATGLLLGWAMLGRPFHSAGILAPVAVTLLADWTENLVQFGQLGRFSTGAALEESWIRIASAATVVKLLFFYGSWLVLLSLFVLVLGRTFRHT